MLEKLSSILVGYLDIIPIVVSFVIMVALTVFVANIVAKIVKYFLPKSVDPVLATFIHRATKFFTFIFGIILVLGLTGMSTGGIAAMFGISSLAIGMSLKDLFCNTIQGIMILVNRPIKLGDEITVGTATGNVMRIGLMYTRLDCGTDEKLVPNNKIFNEIVTVKKSQ